MGNSWLSLSAPHQGEVLQLAKGDPSSPQAICIKAQEGRHQAPVRVCTGPSEYPLLREHIIKQQIKNTITGQEKDHERKKKLYILTPLTALFSCFSTKGLHVHLALGAINYVASPHPTPSLTPNPLCGTTFISPSSHVGRGLSGTFS